jgi:thioredoxin 1
MSILKKVREISLATIILATSSGLSATCESEVQGNYSMPVYIENVSTRYTIEVNVNTYKKEVLESKIPVLVEFYTPWCGYCKDARPYLEDLAKEYKGKVKIVLYDCDQDKSIPRSYGVDGYPTFIFIHKGKEVDRIEGFDLDQLILKTKQHSKRKK